MTSKTYELLDKEELARMHPEVGDPVCPDCGGGLLKGPEGAGSVNVKCKGCNAEFNIVGGLGVQRISDRAGN